MTSNSRNASGTRIKPRSSPSLRDQAGFSLPELLVGLLIGGIIFGVTTTLIVLALQAANRVEDSTASSQRGRVVMEQIGQRLMSQTCAYTGELQANGGPVNVAPLPAFLYASNSKVVFLADTSNERVQGPTGATSGVGHPLVPQIRWLEVKNRKLYDAWTLTKVVTTRDFTRPFNFNAAFMGTLADVNAIVPEASREVVPLVGPAESYGPSGTALTTLTPHFTYYDSVGAPMATPTDGTSSIPQYAGTGTTADTLAAITGVKVAFRVLSDRYPQPQPTDPTYFSKTRVTSADFSTDFFFGRSNACG